MKQIHCSIPLRKPGKSRFFSGTLSAALCLLASGLGQNSYGFESAEHKLIGDTAIKVMIERYQCSKGAFSTNEICSALNQIDANANTTYGDIIACVDYYLTPEKMMGFYNTSTNHPVVDAKNTATEIWPDKECDHNMKTFVQATHSNHTHFQKELLVSLDTYHSLAVSTAREKHHLLRALFTNAIADHYLQDFFAPGHITVRRSKMTDTLANAEHDAVNEHGAIFHITEHGDVKRLHATINKIQELMPDNNSPTGQPENTNLKFINAYLSGSNENGKSACNLKIDKTINEGSKVELKGDGFLNRCGGYQQRMLMLAANVLSLEDVLIPAADNTVLHAFAEYDFQYNTDTDKSRYAVKSILPEISAKLPFGYYAMGSNSKAARSDRLLPLYSDMVWEPSIAEELFSSGAGIARTALSLEVVPFGIVGNGFFENSGVALGIYHYGGSGDVSGNGGSARVLYIIPETESTISFGVRRVHHTDTTLDEWGNGWSVRFDQGYSSFLALFISAGRDYSAATGIPLSFGSYLSAGVTIAFPTGQLMRRINKALSVPNQ